MKGKIEALIQKGYRVYNIKPFALESFRAHYKHRYGIEVSYDNEVKLLIVKDAKS